MGLARQQSTILSDRLSTPVLATTTLLESSNTPKTTPTKTKSYDEYVGEFTDQLFNDKGRQSEVRMIMHCLLYRESKHGLSKGLGDNGMAAGPLQYWEDTWTRMRKAMIKDGIVSEIGTRFDLKEAIRTTIYAIKQGWGKEWGPILRESQGVDYVTCPVPSWY